MTRIKICGLTLEEDVRAASDLGAAYLGFNFAAGSPRRVALEKSRSLARAARGALRVGVFVDETRSEIEAACDAASLDLVQLHREPREEDLSLPVPIIAVVTVAASEPGRPSAAVLSECHALLFDSGDGNRRGRRIPFDWGTSVGDRSTTPIWLAGGLTPENVAEAIRGVRPSGVDVASGVESAPGVKDHERMRRFFEAVRSADGA